MDQTTSDTRDQERVGDLELDSVVDRLLALVEHRVELLGLGHGTGEAVKDEAKCELNTLIGFSTVTQTAWMYPS